MTILDEIIGASTDPTVSTSDLLRRVQIAAHRLGATTIANWARAEVVGYERDDVVPDYRSLNADVIGVFSGPMRTEIRQHLTAIPEGLGHLWNIQLRQPMVELEGLSQGDDDATRPWGAADVQTYEESGVYSIEFHRLFSAFNVISRATLRGIIDVIRTHALGFALELQSQFPDAGSVDGPTVSTEPALERAVYNITNNITGHGTNIAVGADAHQVSTITVGDEAALLLRLEELGLAGEHRQEFIDAIKEDSAVDGPRTTGFLDRVRSGAIMLGAGLTTDLAAEVLVTLGKMFLGIGG